MKRNNVTFCENSREGLKKAIAEWLKRMDHHVDVLLALDELDRRNTRQQGHFNREEEAFNRAKAEYDRLKTKLAQIEREV